MIKWTRLNINQNEIILQEICVEESHLDINRKL